MKTATIATCLVASVALVSAVKIDPRLATARKAIVVPVDDLGDDAPVAACVALHLPMQTPMTIAATKDDAEIVLRIKAHLPSEGTKAVFGKMGGRPSADISAELPDGQKLWSDSIKLGSQWGWGTGEKNHQGTECSLADDVINALRDAMRKSRDGK